MGGEILLVGLVLLLGMGAYWTMVLFPRQRDFQRRQNMARALVEGDEVITGGGVIGKVIRIDAEQGVAFVEISEGVVVRSLIAAMLERFDPEEIAKNAKMGIQKQSDELEAQP